ncbi:BTAD domain-containing putative transcriptional regulator [Kitasatospora sp. NPDC096147]|uniref:AfsR/SARP family transcriptional regulator n=1 Tax=Kitasatospora sp. NPDC096147 TaxID=3364093 RepID=UPI0038300647
MALRFGLLGRLLVEVDGEERPVTGPKVRLLLSALLLGANQALSTERLLAFLWGEDPPPTANSALHNHISRLRRALGPVGATRLHSSELGYRFEVRAGELDSTAFVAEVERARAARLREEWAEVAAAADTGLALWRGEPFAGLPSLAEAPEAVNLGEAHLQLLEWRFDALLHSGRHQGLSTGLVPLTVAHPLREGFHRQLMLALHRTGRTAEALEVFHALRHALDEELGVEPGAAVKAAHQQILLGEPDGAEVPPRRRQGPSPLGPRPERSGSGRSGSGRAESGHSEAGRSDGPEGPEPGDAGDAGERLVRLVRQQRATLAPYPAGPPRPNQLPHRPKDFTGRHGELGSLERGLGRTEAPRMTVITGMGGIGKTALAVEAAHRAREAFPDGQLYVDLHGFGPCTAREPHDLLARLLLDLGIPGACIPEHPDDRANLYRATLAERRVLVVLDNARDSAQVRPLLPGSGASAALVTSRRTLAGLGDVDRLALAPLAEGGRALLSAICGAERVSADPSAVDEIVAACGGLPLALRIAGARLAGRPTLPLSSFARRMSDTPGRMRTLAVDGIAVEEVFAMSLHALRESAVQVENEAAGAFRTLGTWPAHPLSLDAVAALLGLSPDRAGDLLDVLIDAHLLQEAEAQSYRFHDLLGEYAGELARQGEDFEGARHAAVLRLVGWYAAATAAAQRVIEPGVQPVPSPEERSTWQPPEFADEAEAVAWCVREVPALKEAVRIAAGLGRHDLAWRIAAGLYGQRLDQWWRAEWQAA